MKTFWANRRNERGFTLPEVLLTVSILVVLFALATIPIAKMQRELRQTELDGKAEILFQAAQNHMTQLLAAGMGGRYQLASTQLSSVPSDADEDRYSTADGVSLYYVTDADKNDPNSAAYYILPQSQTEAELWGQHWVIEFDKKSGSVYAVFYSESEMDYPDGFQLLRRRDRRVKTATVGYYGGDSVEMNDTGVLHPDVSIYNGETLELRISCTAPTKDKLDFFVTIRDESEHSTGLIRLAGDEVESSYFDYEAVMTLDSLKPQNGESMRFGEQPRFSMLRCGEKLTVTVRVSSRNELVEPYDCVLYTNGLFADQTSGSTAVITCARHLQNLDQGSHVMDGITAAVQEESIDFTGADSWNSVYGELKFQSIVNANLQSYESVYRADGAVYYPEIAHLPIEADGDAGLFETFTGALHGVRLSGARVRGGGNVGALIGTVSGSVSIENCRVYLDPSEVESKLNEKEDYWLEGGVTGGLVGFVDWRGSVDVTTSFAATVLHGTTATGGLVGSARGGFAVQRSYADCYLYSDTQTGGLVGASIGTSAVTLTNCYAAGFQKAPDMAGIAMGSVVRMTNCYSASSPLLGTLTYSTSAPEEHTTVSRTYYISDVNGTTIHLPGTSRVSWRSEDRTAAVDSLDPEAYTAVTGGSNTVAYNLMDGMGLTAYTYPKLAGVPHYGDWKAEFESGSLVYYEKYQDGTYGFLGGNVSSLSNTLTVLGDGYGMVYDAEPATDVFFSDTAADGTVIDGTLAADTAVSVRYDGREGWLLPLPAEAVNAGYTQGFYHKLTVGEASYLYNPHFACTVTDDPADGSAVDAPTRILLRTARQLYNLSLYYDDGYRTLLQPECVFAQERSVDYKAYDWALFGLDGKTPAVQSPIGDSDATPFSHTYNGGKHEIFSAPISGSGLNDNAAYEVYAGLFGCNAGELRDIVLIAGAQDTIIGFEKGIQLKTAYVGALVGYNASRGTIYNCAAAGYRIKVLANNGSTVYAGALVGFNAGAIETSSVSTPSLYAESVFAQLNVGGFAGGNRGRINRCYAIAAVNIPTIRNGRTALAGFAAQNTGVIRNAYCATSMISAGALPDGFAASGSTINCYYLNGGTYSYLGQDRLYECTTRGSAKPVQALDLEQLSLPGFGAGAESRYPVNTQGTLYPYPASVRGADGFVHYGDWPLPSDLGEVGMLYWELEEGGANSGYHFSYIGFTGAERKEGGSLCEAHDDGGVVSAYGYGYYWLTGSAKPTLIAQVVTNSDNGTFYLDGENTDASKALAELMNGYSFVTYQTGESGLRIVSARQANGTWTLTRGGTSYAYAVCPFFADAFSDEYAANPAELGKPGQRDYQIRSAEQLQFINWSCDVSTSTVWNGYGSTTSYTYSSGSTARDVTSETYNHFPYLQYATVTWTPSTNGEQKKADVLAGTTEYGARPVRSWQQSHDLNGEKMTDGFQPIAGAVNNSTSSSYNTILYNWFGGEYDGQNYYIKNIGINSYCYNVGLFGTTAGAQLKNIVLYSDNGSVIQRTTNATPPRGAAKKDKDQYQTSYAIGGLVGIAYDYKADLGSSTITNCAIAGYTIIDASKNKQQLGEAVVGGLIGVSSANLMKCSAVVDLQINCTHRDSGTGALNASRWGNYIRVGGLVGGARYDVTDCYTGGSISVGQDTLIERVSVNDSGDNTTLLELDSTDRFKMHTTNKQNWQGNANPATYVYLGGIGGSGFSANFSNFTAKSDSDDGTPYYKNCYTYMNFPTMQGTITSISLIGSVADRFAQKNASLKMENCYYLQSSADKISVKGASKCRPQLYWTDGTRETERQTKSSVYDLLCSGTDATQNRRDMLDGKLNYLHNFGWDNGWPNYSGWNAPVGLTYAEMSNRFSTEGNFQTKLGDGFSWVTIQEVGAEVNGKYSFPGKDKEALDGQNYPFPTVLKQKSNHEGEPDVNLHYGDWPHEGLFWAQSSVTIDRIADYSAADQMATATVRLRFENMTGDLSAVEVSTSSLRDNIVRVLKTEVVTETKADGTKDSYLAVTLEGRANGAEEITAKYGDTYVARLSVSVTAQLNIVMDAAIETNHLVAVDMGVTQALNLKATNRAGEALTEGLTWSVVSSDPAIADVVVDRRNVPQGVKGVAAGETTLLVAVRYKLNENTTIETSRIVSVTVFDAADGTA